MKRKHGPPKRVLKRTGVVHPGRNQWREHRDDLARLHRDLHRMQASLSSDFKFRIQSAEALLLDAFAKHAKNVECMLGNMSENLSQVMSAKVVQRPDEAGKRGE